MSSKHSAKNKKILIPRKKKIAFVCSGGAAKAGAYHLGVALALQEKGFKFQGGLINENSDSQENKLTMKNESGKEISIYVGSSAGSLICSYLACGHSLERIIDSFLGREPDPSSGTTLKPLKRLSYKIMFAIRKDMGIFQSISSLTSAATSFSGFGKSVSKVAQDSYENLFKWKWLKIPGFFSTSGIEKYLREDVLPSNSFENYSADLFIVGTQLNHSRKVVFGKYNYSPPSDDKTVSYVNNVSISEACAASTALPPVFAPYAITNERGQKIYYFDGEIRDTLSTHVGFDAGADLIISSYTHQPYHFSKEIGSLHEHGIPAILVQALYLSIERKIQNHELAHERSLGVLEAAETFFKEHNLPDDLRKSFLDLMARKLGYKSGVDYIYIHPKHTDHELFFGDNFNLSNAKMTEYVKIGFRCAIEVLRKYEFET